MPIMSRLKNASLPVIAALWCISPVYAVQADDTAATRADAAGEAALAKLLEGRIAGEPVRCLQDNQRERMQIIDRTAFVFRDGKTIYVNRPDGAAFLDDFDLPVFRIFGSSLCRMDQVELRDRNSRIGGPIVTMNDFIPYTPVQDQAQ